jgi:DNA polymerase I-like protein with 3'-5' exonuclease and polymerase domains
MSTKLTSYLSKLQEKEKQRLKDESFSLKNTLIFWGTREDTEYLPYLKQCVGSATVYVRLESIDVITRVQMYCKTKHVNKVISTSIELLKKLLSWEERAEPSLSNYSGSYFKIPTLTGEGYIEIIFIQPLKNLVTVNYGKFIATRLISKFTEPDKWIVPTEFSWSLLLPEYEEELFLQFSSAFLISIDIETFKENAIIRCVSYTGMFFDAKEAKFKSISVVLPLDSEFALAVMRKWNWELKASKVFQNGKYDIAYFFRYGAPVFNYIYDTANLFHSWYSELPKDLGFLNSFFLREATYWKDLSDTINLEEFYKYNALDSWGTANVLLAMIHEIPDWAIQNYLIEFPLVFPCHMAEMTGINRDVEKLTEARKKQDDKIQKFSTSLDRILGVRGFNVKSPTQMKALFKILGCGDLKSADEKNLKRVRFRHPFNARIVNLILEIRKARTVKEKYLQIGENKKEFSRIDGTGNRILFALNPNGTDSSRLASKEHHFWCGLQIQNIPRGDEVKCTLSADPDFFLAEVDLEQAETRDTAYIAGEVKLIDAVENSPDFHSANASAFFGIPFNELWDVENKKTKNKEIRDLAKRVNHGANYNMGENVLVETMGEENITKAKFLLKLPKFWTYKQVAEHLLKQFHLTYPGIKSIFYAGVVDEILRTGKLIHHVLNEPTWTRFCFGRPDKNKSDLNSYIAHPPQSLNARTLNKAFLKIFFEIAINPEHSKNFKLIAQIHDSILFQYRKGHEYLCDMVKERMEIPVTIKGYDGKVRTFIVPASVKLGDESKKATYWSEIK